MTTGTSTTLRPEHRKLKVGVIGCGAVAEFFHLPTAARSDRVEITAVVDKSLARARALAAVYKVPMVADDYRETFGNIDAAILTLPHHLHAPVAIDLLEKSIHVLVEKPMALTGDECDRMIKAAAETDSTLAVALLRRLYTSSQLVKKMIEKGLLGKITRFDYREGIVYDWNVTSDFMFRKDSGGGVLADTGAHALDLLLWWLGDYESVEYHDDACGGVEAECEIYLHLKSGARGIVELSRTRKLRNTCLLYGEHGTIEVGTNLNSLVRLKFEDPCITFQGQARRGAMTERSMKDLFARQLEDFIDAIRDAREPFVPGREGKRAVKLIEACNDVRQAMKCPWDVLKSV